MKRKSSELLRIVTNSERTASACWRRWWWRYHLGFSGFDAPAPLRQGSLVHRLLAAWYLSGMTLTIAELARDVGDPWAVARAAYVAEKLPPDVAGERFVEDQEILQESLGIVGHYLLHWGDHDRARWEIIAVEASFARGVPHPKTGRPIWYVVNGVDGKKLRKRLVHGGQVDLLVREKDTGDLWFVEHKTTASEDFEDFFRKLHLDTQVRGYAWALRDPIVIGSLFSTSAISEPQPVVGVIYNAIRKAVPRVPPLLKGRPTKAIPNPPSPGLSKAKIDTTRAVYLATIYAHGFDPGAYADILYDLERKRFFARERYVITDRELEDWIVDHGRWALEATARAKQPQDEPPPRQTSLCVEHHRACEYASLCVEDGMDARRSFRVRTVRHEELPGDFAEPSALQERVALGVATADGRKVHLDPVERLMAGYARAKGLPDPFAGELAQADPFADL